MGYFELEDFRHEFFLGVGMHETAVSGRNEGDNEHFEKDVGMYDWGLDSPELCVPKLVAVALLALQADHQRVQFLLDTTHLTLAAPLLHPIAAIADKALK